jgi:hypothetical protein
MAALALLGEHCVRRGDELIVVCSRPYPELRLGSLGRAAQRIVAPEGSTHAQLRVLGMSNATGDIVAMVDDPTVIDAAWLDHLRGRGKTVVDIEVTAPVPVIGVGR